MDEMDVTITDRRSQCQTVTSDEIKERVLLSTWTELVVAGRRGIDSLRDRRYQPASSARRRTRANDPTLSRRNRQPVALEAVLEVIENSEFLAGHNIRGTCSDATPDGSERGLEDG
jgi:hypothetical protein